MHAWKNAIFLMATLAEQRYAFASPSPFSKFLFILWQQKDGAYLRGVILTITQVSIYSFIFSVSKVVKLLEYYLSRIGSFAVPTVSTKLLQFENITEYDRHTRNTELKFSIWCCKKNGQERKCSHDISLFFVYPLFVYLLSL